RPPQEVAFAKRASMRVAEDKSIKMSLDRHPFPMALQSRDGNRWQVHLPARPPGFWLADPEPSVKFMKRVAHVKRGPCKVHILPLETQQFTLPQPRRDGKDVERLKPVTFGGLEELAHLARGERLHSLPGCSRAHHRVADIPRN